MGQHTYCILFVCLSICSLVYSNGGPTVKIFTQCASWVGGYYKKVPGDNKMRVIIDGSSFYARHSLSCMAVFWAEDNDNRLQYEVKSYTMYDEDVVIKIETKSPGYSYREVESYSKYTSSPEINQEKLAEVYFRITVTRESHSNDHFYMTLDLYTDEYSSELHDAKVTRGTIIGIVLGIAVIIILLIIVCCVCRRKNTEGVVVARNARIDIPDIGTRSAYTNAPPAENFTSHPGYPADPPQSYGQPAYEPYEKQLPLPHGQPPSYTEAIKPSAPSYTKPREE